MNTVSNFLKNEITPFLYGAFLSRIMKCEKDQKKLFYAYTCFRKSKFATEFNFEKYAFSFLENLNNLSGNYQWEIHSNKSTIELRLYLHNDVDFSKEEFFKKLRLKMLEQRWIEEEEDNDEKKDFIRGFMELRGSVDTKLKFLSIDYYYNNKIELKKGAIIIESMNVYHSYINFNFRDLQPQYVSGKNKRNAQFRMNLNFYARKIGFVNHYKAKIFENVFHEKAINKDGLIFFHVSFKKSEKYEANSLNYLNFMTNNIYKKTLNVESIKKLREKIGFDKKDRKLYRSIIYRNIVEESHENICADCGTDKTFIRKKTGENYFEIHHVIPLHNGDKFDVPYNMVKLCVNCHKKLGRGFSIKDEQVKSIIRILENKNEIFEYVKSYFELENIYEIANKIFFML